MNTKLTLTEFLENTGARLHFFDLGRRVESLSRDDFLAFEKAEQPYPYPMQSKAWFAVVQERATDLSEPLIWFMRFDLDEQAKLVQATRDYFLHRFIEIANEKPEQADLGQALEDNPYVFKPREDKMANLHACLGQALQREPSQFFAHAQEYFAGLPGWDQWQFVGYQGIAELAARCDETKVAEQLCAALPQLPEEPLIALCQCLENHPLPDALSTALTERLQASLAENKPPALIANLLRGLAKAPAAQAQSAVQAVLNHDGASDPEVLAAVGGRLWETLGDADTAKAYLAVLAGDGVEQAIFNHCLADLLRLPSLQGSLLALLRDPQRSDAVAEAFGRMLGQEPS